MMVMMNRKSGKHIGALGMPVSLVPQIKELVGNSHFLSEVKSAVVHNDNVAILENCRTICPIYRKSFIKEIQKLHTIRRASQNIRVIYSVYGRK